MAVGKYVMDRASSIVNGTFGALRNTVILPFKGAIKGAIDGGTTFAKTTRGGLGSIIKNLTEAISGVLGFTEGMKTSIAKFGEEITKTLKMD